MRILMLTLYLPYPPNSGGQIRSYNLIKHLSKKHEITLFSIIKKGEEKYAPELEKYCKEVRFFYRTTKPWTIENLIKYAFSVYPFLVIRNTSEKARRAVDRELKNNQYDLIHVETFYLMSHVPETSVPIILVDQTIEYKVYQHFVNSKPWYWRLPLSQEVWRLKFWESKFWKDANRVVAVSEADREQMQNTVPGLAVDIIPNAPGDDLADLYAKRKKPDFENPTIFFQSNFLWLQNVEGANILINEVFPEIKKRIPGAKCLISGQNIHGKIKVSDHPDIEILELETSDTEGVRKAYLRGTVFVAPLWGPGGTRLKILSAMSTGIPVVTTPVGAQGLDVVDGKDMYINSTSQEMAESVVKLLSDERKYRNMVLNARKVVDTKYNWETIANRLSKIYEETARTK